MTIPPGLTDGFRHTLAGRGGPGQFEGAPGDLVLVFRVLPAADPPRPGKDVPVTVELTAAEARAGVSRSPSRARRWDGSSFRCSSA